MIIRLFQIVIVQYWTFLYCYPCSYRFSLLISLLNFMSLFWTFVYGFFPLLFFLLIALSIVLALPTIAIAIVVTLLRS